VGKAKDVLEKGSGGGKYLEDKDKVQKCNTLATIFLFLTNLHLRPMDFEHSIQACRTNSES